jgi:ligand-binding sensor domain-containing protein
LLLAGLAVAAAAPKAAATNYYGGEDYTLTVRHSGKCLDIEYNAFLYFWLGMKFFNTADGAAVVQSRCTGSGTANQVWKLYLTGISGPVKLANKLTGKCMDVSGGSLVNYTSVVQMPCAESDSQLWYAYQVATFNGIPYYVLDNVKTGKCLEVAWGSTGDAAALVQGNCTWGASQLWDLYNVPFNYHGK